MSKNLLTRVLACACLALGLASPMSAAIIFFDDFEDGSAIDGAPVTWEPFPRYGLNDGSFGVTRFGDYRLVPNAGRNFSTLLTMVRPSLDVSNVSIRTQVRAGGEFDDIWLAARTYEASPVERLYEGGITAPGEVYIGYTPPEGDFVYLVQGTTELRTHDEDVVLQFDLIGDSLSLFAWSPDEPKPSEPLLQVTSILYASGNVGLGYNTTGATSPIGSATFRYVQVADSPIPEPSAALLALIAYATFAARLARRRGRRIAIAAKSAVHAP